MMKRSLRGAGRLACALVVVGALVRVRWGQGAAAAVRAAAAGSASPVQTAPDQTE